MTKRPSDLPDFWDSGVPYVPLPEQTRAALAEEREARRAVAKAGPAEPADPHGWREAFRLAMPTEHRLAAERAKAAEARSRPTLLRS